MVALRSREILSDRAARRKLQLIAPITAATYVNHAVRLVDRLSHLLWERKISAGSDGVFTLGLLVPAHLLRERRFGRDGAASWADRTSDLTLADEVDVETAGRVLVQHAQALPAESCGHVSLEL
ncbi:MAG: hypothetical protein HY690_18470 [Chloroflexi bacterium]|nr:hypothetical protein [Chloroflexota bacterium]